MLVIDNAPCHSNTESVFEENAYRQDYLLRLGPYSPMLNPIENCWSQIKAYAKQHLSLHMGSILEISNSEGISIGEQRTQQLEQVISESYREVSRDQIKLYCWYSETIYWCSHS